MTFIGIEAGGTKVVLATGTGPDDVNNLVRVPTTTPVETLGAMADYVSARLSEGDVAGIGLATFGPVDLDPASASYGHMSTTPKPG